MTNDSLVIIPTYNEKENIGQIIDAVFSLPKSFDILVIDDGSPDGTAALVKFHQKKTDEHHTLHLIEREGKRGLGTAYLAGFSFALEKGYTYIFEMDADFSHNPSDLERLYETCAVEGFDMAIGSRYVSGVNVINWPMGRVIISYFASHYVRFITGMPINDTTAGFVCFNRRVLECIDLDSIRFIGYAFQIEMKFTALMHGFRLHEVPIVFTDRTRGKSKMSGSIFKEAFFGVIQMKIFSYFKKYLPPAYHNSPSVQG